MKRKAHAQSSLQRFLSPGSQSVARPCASSHMVLEYADEGFGSSFYTHNVKLSLPLRIKPGVRGTVFSLFFRACAFIKFPGLATLISLIESTCDYLLEMHV